MGEVYRARDPRLGREVAVKVLPAELGERPDRLRRFELEAKAVAALSHPHILTAFDIGAHDGAPYLVTELLEGLSLRDVLERGPLPVSTAVDYAQQIADGLAAAHAHGIVHRDLKPGNVFVTQERRVKILDFGLAKLTDAGEGERGPETASTHTGPGVVMGTVAYMSPEQVRGQEADARSDIFALGAVLYEMLSGHRAFAGDTTADVVTAILTKDPEWLSGSGLRVPAGLERIVRRCLEKDPGGRFHGAHDLALALEAVRTASPGPLSPHSTEERGPYPGLSAFAETDAGVFFGREEEIRGLWERIRSRRFLALIGPSGAGKTSLVRAGVITARPRGWGAACATPGAQPALGLARAFTVELAGDADTMGELLRGVTEMMEGGKTERVVASVSRWRSRYAEALLVVDQFEELFTLCPRDTQEAFVSLLGRLASEADVHVLLSLRDDFLIRCSEHEALAPVFEALTPLPPLTRDGLRRAIVTPAARLGYRLEDEALTEEMIESVVGLRGALPMLAFAVSCLWERRDRGDKLLTRKAYEEIGGVVGALAQHAEATMDRIGSDRLVIVREVFRNLVTSQGTRAVVDRAELLSAFPGRQEAEEILGELIDARLLTSWEVRETEGQPAHHRIEIVHESLVKAWPRLVRWQAQDEEGALLRDQLKQASHLWEERGRTADLLWTGTAYREYEVWRERYLGALTALEEDFGRAMTEKVRERKRLRDAVIASVVLALAAIAIAIGISRQQAAKARDEARAEATRAEASKLLALARAEIDHYATAALAYARKSLELDDTPEGRRLAVEILWRGPVARVLPLESIARHMGVPASLCFGWTALSPDGEWLATQSFSGDILLFPRGGGLPRFLPARPDAYRFAFVFGPQSNLLVVAGSGQRLSFLSVPDLLEVRSVQVGGVASLGWIAGGRLVTLTSMSSNDKHALIRLWPLSGGDSRAVGAIVRSGGLDVDPTGSWLAFGRGRTIRVHLLDTGGSAAERVLGSTRDEFDDVNVFPEGDRLASVDKSGEIRIWSAAPGRPWPLRIIQGPRAPGAFLSISREGRHLARGATESSVYLWDLNGPPNAEPVILTRPEPAYAPAGAFDPKDQWLVAGNGFTIAFWPLANPWTRVLRGGGSSIFSMSFTGDSRWLASCAVSEPARLWPVSAAGEGVTTLAPAEPCWSLATASARAQILVGTTSGKLLSFQTAGGAPRVLLPGWEGGSGTRAVAFDQQGRRAVAGPANGDLTDPKRRILRIWNLESGEERVLSIAHFTDASSWGLESIRFAPDGALFLGGQGGVHRLVVPAEPRGIVSSETLYAAGRARFDLSRDGRYALVWANKSYGSDHFDELLLFDLAKRTSRRITSHGKRLYECAFDASGRIVVTGDVDGVVRAGPATGEEPHLLLGHTGPVTALAVSPDGRWIASATDQAIHLWPMPDMTKRPLHTLPHAELLAKLDALTNLRLAADPTSSTGWKLEVGPFPGWGDEPRW